MRRPPSQRHPTGVQTGRPRRASTGVQVHSGRGSLQDVREDLCMRQEALDMACDHIHRIERQADSERLRAEALQSELELLSLPAQVTAEVASQTAVGASSGARTASTVRRIGLRPEAHVFVPNPISLIRRELASWTGVIMQGIGMVLAPRRTGGRQQGALRRRGRRCAGIAAPAFVGEDDSMSRFMALAESAGWLS